MISASANSKIQLQTASDFFLLYLLCTYVQTCKQQKQCCMDQSVDVIDTSVSNPAETTELTYSLECLLKLADVKNLISV